MGKEIISSMRDLAQERGIELETVLTALEETLLAAARKSANYSREVTVSLDRKTGNFKCSCKLFIVQKVEKTDSEISLHDVQERFPDKNYTEANLGEEIEWSVNPGDFGRITALNANQAFQQRLRMIEKANACESYKDLVNTLLHGEVRRVDRSEVILNFGAAEGVMTRENKIPGEDYEVGSMLTVLLLEINQDKPGPSLIVSRSHQDFVTRLFEREVSEIADGQVEIKGVARDPGHRSKIAVASSDPRVDPVGACVGMRGNRVKTIVRELNGEKVDIINWDPDIRKFVENALKPAKITAMTVDENRHSIRIEVPEDQLSLSIGKKGLNASLATKLTGWKLDIVKSAEVPSNGPDFEEQKRNAVLNLVKALEITESQAETLVTSGFNSVDIIRDAEENDLTELDGIDAALAASMKAKAAQN